MSPADESNPAEPRVVPVRATPIELSQFIKFAGSAETGGAAKQAISEGKVLVNGQVENRKGRKLAAGDRVTVGGQTLMVGLQPAQPSQ